VVTLDEVHGPMTDGRTTTPLGIAAIAVHEPAWVLDNGWFGAAMPRKFVHHTGIESRAVSLDDEVTMARDAVRALVRQTACDLTDCRGILLVSPSLIPPAVAQRHLEPAAAACERPGHAARHLVRRLGLRHCRAVGINWFCSGYSRALALVHHRWAPRMALGDGQFVIVVVASRISRITDYACRQTGGLFGDMATATLLAPVNSRRHPVHFTIFHAHATKQPLDRPAFDFHLRADVPVPMPDGGSRVAARRLVYSLDGMAIAEAAPRAMAAAVATALAEARLAGSAVDFVVPHQAGSGIVRFTGMQLDGLGIGGELVNGLTRQTGNVSACSIPHALHRTWGRLRGIVACPTTAVGNPGRAEISQGCVLLRATPHHERQPTRAAA
jgi:3-oxoacyl-[acyl-carrier-protein] synthase-3